MLLGSCGCGGFRSVYVARFVNFRHSLHVPKKYEPNVRTVYLSVRYQVETSPPIMGLYGVDRPILRALHAAALLNGLTSFSYAIGQQLRVLGRWMRTDTTPRRHRDTTTGLRAILADRITGPA